MATDGFGKHFTCMYEGSMLGAGANIFAVWGWIISHTINSRVEINPRLVAFQIGMTESEVKTAMEYLERPDEDSRTGEDDGRRIVREGSFLYRVPSHEKYRQRLSREERNEKAKLHMREKRSQVKEVNDVSTVVSNVSSVSKVARAGAEVEAEAERAKLLTRDERPQTTDVNSVSTVLAVVSKVSKVSHTEAEAEANTTAQSADALHAAIAGTLPLASGKDHSITKQQVAGWSKLFPAVDVMQSLRTMKAWLLANPTKRKTSKGVERFIVNWLTKEQDRGGTRIAPQSIKPKRTLADKMAEQERAWRERRA